MYETNPLAEVPSQTVHINLPDYLVIVYQAAYYRIGGPAVYPETSTRSSAAAAFDNL